MQLNRLIKNIHALEIKGDSSVNITAVGFDSRNITEGQLFIALSGTRVDGHHFIDETIDKVVEIKSRIKAQKLKVLISVDGGINNENLKKMNDVDIACVGSFITNSEDWQRTINSLR